GSGRHYCAGSGRWASDPSSPDARRRPRPCTGGHRLGGLQRGGGDAVLLQHAGRRECGVGCGLGCLRRPAVRPGVAGGRERRTQALAARALLLLVAPALVARIGWARRPPLESEQYLVLVVRT